MPMLGMLTTLLSHYFAVTVGLAMTIRRQHCMGLVLHIFFRLPLRSSMDFLLNGDLVAAISLQIQEV